MRRDHPPGEISPSTSELRLDRLGRVHRHSSAFKRTEDAIQVPWFLDVGQDTLPGVRHPGKTGVVRRRGLEGGGGVGIETGQCGKARDPRR